MIKFNLQVTGKSNDSSPFSSNRPINQEDMETIEIKRVIDCIANFAEEINVTGGEPLKRQDIDQILKYIHEKGIRVSLTTDGIHLPQQETALQYVNRIYLPLDSVYEKALKKLGTNPNQMIHTIQNVGFIHAKYPNVEVAINTLLTTENYQQLGQIFGLVRLLDCVEWKISQYFSMDLNKESNIFQLEENDFNESVNMLKYSELEDRIVISRALETDTNEWTITPNFELIKIIDKNIVFYGNILEMNESYIKELLKSNNDKIKRQTTSQH